MGNGSQTEGRVYSEDEINKLASLLSLAESDEAAKKELSDELETAAFWYLLAREDRVHEPPIPASKLSPKPAVPAKALEKSVEQIRQFPRQISGDLVRCANELGDKIGHHYGANRLNEALDEVDWIVACLRGLEKKYIDQITDAGGNRRSEPRCRFNLALREIMLKFNGGPLGWWTEDRSDGNKCGLLLDLLEICYRPIDLNVLPSSLAKTYEEHTGK